MTMSIDYMDLSKKTIKNRYLIPNIEELIDELHSVKYFTKIHIWSG